MQKHWIKIFFVILLIVIISVIAKLSSNSNLEQAFEENKNNLIEENKPISKEKISKEMFKDFPLLIQKYIEQSGFIGQEDIQIMEMKFKNIYFRMDKDQAPLRIDYNVVSSTKECERIALINSSIYGIPFNGYDFFEDDAVFMKGELANKILIFNQTGEDLVKGSALTYLSEIFLAPNALINKSVEFQELNNNQIKGIIHYKGYDLEGIFTFNDAYEMIRFETSQRPNVDAKGKVNYYKWIAELEDYQRNEQGINLPRKFKATWEMPEQDFTYFDGEIYQILYQ